MRETGVDDPWVSQRWFRREVVEFLRDDPAGFAARLGEKALHAVCSREFTRNIDVYLFREWSSLLSLLVWKAGRFGFPFGALLPLAVVGCVLALRRMPAVVWLLPAAQLARARARRRRRRRRAAARHRARPLRPGVDRYRA